MADQTATLKIGAEVEGVPSVKDLTAAYQQMTAGIQNFSSLLARVRPAATATDEPKSLGQKVINAAGNLGVDSLRGAANVASGAVKTAASSLLSFAGPLGNLAMASLTTAPTAIAAGVALVTVVPFMFKLGVTYTLMRRSWQWANDSMRQQFDIAYRTRRTFPGIIEAEFSRITPYVKARMGIANALFGEAAGSMEDMITRRLTPQRLMRGIRGERDLFSAVGITPQFITQMERMKGQELNVGGRVRLDLTDYLAIFIKKREALETQILAAPEGSALRRTLSLRKGRLLDSSLKIFNAKFADVASFMTSDDLRKLAESQRAATSLNVVTKESMQNAAQFKHAMHTTREIFYQLKMGIGREVQPIVTRIMTDLANWLLPIREDGKSMAMNLRDLGASLAIKGWEVMEALLRRIDTNAIKRLINVVKGWKPESTLETLKSFIPALTKFAIVISWVSEWAVRVFEATRPDVARKRIQEQFGKFGVGAGRPVQGAGGAGGAAGGGAAGGGIAGGGGGDGYLGGGRQAGAPGGTGYLADSGPAGGPPTAAPQFQGVSPATGAGLERQMTLGMAPAGSGVRAASGKQVTITSPSGRKFHVDAEFAPNFQGFINDYEAAGGRIGTASGGLSARPGNASYHPKGYAIDVNQTGWGIRGGKGAVNLPVAEEERLAAEWGLYPGSRFKSRRGPDTGHFEVRNREAARAALARKQAAGGQQPVAVAQQQQQAQAGDNVFGPPPIVTPDGKIVTPQAVNQAPAGAPVAPTAPAGPGSNQALRATVRGRRKGKETMYVSESDLRERAKAHIQNSKLVGHVPAGGEKYGIRTGSADEWADYFVGLAKKESSLNPETANMTAKERAISGGAGSHGLYQISPQDARIYGIKNKNFTMAELQDPETNLQAAIKMHEKLAKEKGGLAGGKVSGVGRYWGPIRRRENLPITQGVSPPVVTQAAVETTEGAAVVTAPAQQAVLRQDVPAGKKKMIFLHGMQSRYGETDPAKVEADARRYAEARGYELEVIKISGDDRAGQLKEARKRLREGGADYGGVLGFSAGGATADQLRTEFPGLDIKSVSTGKTGKGGTYFAGRPHMQQVGALADQAEQSKVETPASPPPPIQPVSAVGPVGQQVAMAKRVKEATGGKTRNKPITPALKGILDSAAEATGVSVTVTSGGQSRQGYDPKKKFGNIRYGTRTGSERHDIDRGTIGAADLQLQYPDGTVLDMNKPKDKAIMGQFIRHSVAMGAVGVGGDVPYMGASTLHIGGGTARSWGGKNAAGPAPQWVKDAHAAGLEDRRLGRIPKAPQIQIPQAQPQAPSVTAVAPIPYTTGDVFKSVAEATGLSPDVAQQLASTPEGQAKIAQHMREQQVEEDRKAIRGSFKPVTTEEANNLKAVSDTLTGVDKQKEQELSAKLAEEKPRGRDRFGVLARRTEARKARDEITKAPPDKSSKEVKEGTAAGEAAAKSFKEGVKDVKIPVKSLTEEEKNRDKKADEKEKQAEAA